MEKIKVLLQHIGLEQLRLYRGRADRQHRLSGEDGRTLGDGPYVAGEFEIAQIVKEALVKYPAGAEICNVLFIKVQLLHIVDDLFKSGRNGKAAVVRHGTIEYIEIGDLILSSADEIAVAHCQLIKIAQHCEIYTVGTLHDTNPPCGSAAQTVIENLSGSYRTGDLALRGSALRGCGACTFIMRAARRFYVFFTPQVYYIFCTK